MENQVTNALATLKFLTSSIREPATKTVLRKALRTSLEKLHEYDQNTITRALDMFYTPGLKVVV